MLKALARQVSISSILALVPQRFFFSCLFYCGILIICFARDPLFQCGYSSPRVCIGDTGPQHGMKILVPD